MARPQTPADLSALIDQDLTWRLREISDLRAAAGRADVRLRSTIVRGGVTLLYAHWEGHVKCVAEQYLDYLTLRRLRFGDLQPAFLLGRFHSYFLSGNLPASYAERLSSLNALLRAPADRFSQPHKELVAPRSNLNASVLANICVALSIDPRAFTEDGDFIDRVLLRTRNQIAHGEGVSIDLKEFQAMSERVIELMRRFKTLVENDVTLEAYRARLATAHYPSRSGDTS